jgi:hypothetical protein
MRLILINAAKAFRRRYQQAACFQYPGRRTAAKSEGAPPVTAGLDPAIHRLAKEMDPQVRPAGDRQSG